MNLEILDIEFLATEVCVPSASSTLGSLFIKEMP